MDMPASVDTSMIIKTEPNGNLMLEDQFVSDKDLIKYSTMVTTANANQHQTSGGGRRRQPVKPKV